MPEAINLAKPGTLGTAIIQLISGNGPTSKASSTASHIKIKTEQIQISTSVQAVETTGDGDQYANYDHGSMIRIRFSITGYALAEAAISLEQMATDTTGGTNGNGDYLMQLNYHGSGSSPTRQIKGRMLIENISVAYSKKSPLVAMTMSGLIRRDPNTALEA